MTIYTCTLNLAIDLFIETEELVPFVVNRTKEDDIQANGKGVNVSLILKMLGLIIPLWESKLVSLGTMSRTI